MGQARQRPQASKPAHYISKKPPKKAKSSGCCWWIVGLVAIILIGLGAVLAVLIYRERYPAKQRCPPETDRFYDHCMEGRKHYLLSLDWSCLGARRTEAMRMALSMPNDGKPLKGIGEVPSWLTDENAEALRGAPCMRNVLEDKACRYCKPTPKPQKADAGAAASDAQPASATASDAEPTAAAEGGGGS